MAKTILITISRGSIARNILQTKMFGHLRGAGLRLVILSPAYNQPDFQETFGGANIFFEPLYEHRWNRLDFFFVGIHKALVYNASTELRDKYGILSKEETSVLRRILKRAIFKPLSKVNFFKEVARALDALLVPDRYYGGIFKKYEPDLVFSTNPTEDADSFVIKAAKRRGIKVIALPKSWDNLPKMSFRAKPDRLIVWGDSMVEDARAFQNIDDNVIRRCGVPQFDFYRRPELLMSREQFFSLIGAAPDRQLLIFGSSGKVTPADPALAEILALLVGGHKLVKNCTLFIRPYFALRGEEDKFKHLLGLPNVIVDHFFERRAGFRDSWDYSWEQVIFFTNLLYHSAMMISHASTLTLDAAAFDKPIIHLGFDGYSKKTYGESTLRWYSSAHFRRVTDTGASILVKNADELSEAINSYLKNPSQKSEGRARLRDYICYKIDGQASERVSKAILDFLGS